MEKEFKNVELVYAGRRINVKDKIFHKYIYRDGTREAHFSTPISNFAIGTVFEIPVSEDGVTFKTGQANPIGRHSSETDVAVWEEEAKHAYMMAEKNKKYKKVNPTIRDEHVEGLKRIYTQLNHAQRKVFLYGIIHDIQS